MRVKNVEKDYLSIKEFAEFVGITEASLRHYDKMGVFTPAKHGVEFENKYRFCSPRQITTVKLMYSGYCSLSFSYFFIAPSGFRNLSIVGDALKKAVMISTCFLCGAAHFEALKRRIVRPTPQISS